MELKMSNSTIKSRGWLQGDMSLWMILIVLCVISVIEVYSASSNMTYATGKYWGPMVEHTTYVIFGVVFAWLVHLTPCKFFKLVSTLGIVISIGLLIYALAVGGKINGAGRWISIAGRTIQPSEIAKISTIGFMAFIMASMRDKSGYISSAGIKLAAIVTFIICGLIASENFSTAGLLFVVILAMLFFGRAKTKVILWIVIPILLSGGALFYSAKTVSKETVVNLAENVSALHRLPTWVNRLQKDNSMPEDPNEYDVASNQQVAHAQIAIATSNIVGKGPGKSIERDYLPAAHSDFIYAIIIEEMGIEGAIFVVLLYIFLLYRTWRIANKCATRFPAYLAMGLATMLVTQALINMGVAVGMLPVTGQPLPLISKGGTSTIITCVYIGMIISVSRSAKKIESENEQMLVAPITPEGE